MSQNLSWKTTVDLDCETDEILLVQATSFDKWFLETLEVLGVEWERIPGISSWIQFEIPSLKLQWLIQGYSDVALEIID